MIAEAAFLSSRSERSESFEEPANQTSSFQTSPPSVEVCRYAMVLTHASPIVRGRSSPDPAARSIVFAMSSDFEAQYDQRDTENYRVEADQPHQREQSESWQHR